MKRHVRIRCPICGMLGWQSRFAKEFDFEVVVHEIESKGRGKITNKYHPPEHQEGVWILKLALIDKMEAALEKLKDEVREEQSAGFHKLLDERQYKEAVSTLGIYHANFSMYSSLVVGDGVEVLSMPSTVEVASEPASVVTPGYVSAFEIAAVQTGAEEEEGVEDTEMPSEPLYSYPKLKPRRLNLPSSVERGSDIIAGFRSVLEEVNENEERTESNSEIESE